MLEDGMLAKALLVWALGLQAKVTLKSGRARDGLLVQRNAVLRELRVRISTPDACTSDAVLWTILLLVSTEVGLL